jgi:hypothetical protein
MADPQIPQEKALRDIEDATNMPERAGYCAYLDGYVPDGETVCYFGVELICHAPKLVPTGNNC